MKTILHFIFKKSICLFAIFNLFFLIKGAAQPDLSFTSYTLVSGTDLQQGALYRFTNVKPGVDALVKFTNSVNGATLDSLDQIGSGFQEGFQPLVGVPANSDGYIVFNINFVQAGTNSNVQVSKVTHTSIDIDGHQFANDSLYEWESVNMGNGSLINFSLLNPAILVTQSGQWITGKNTGGVEYPGIDTTAKNAMFTVTNLNVSGYQIRVGVDNRSGEKVSRQRSSYYKKFTFPGSLLPVQLASFTATLNTNKVDLKWTTETEINLSHFAVEKSTDGVNFSEAGVAFAYGNTTDKTNYSFSDHLTTDQAGVIYYRIRSVDRDGKSEYSDTRVIRISKQSDNKISILTYPNPVTNELRITIPASWQNKKVVYELYNANGQIAKRTQATASSQTETVNVSNLAPGFYIVRVAFDGQVAQQKIVKQ